MSPRVSIRVRGVEIHPGADSIECLYSMVIGDGEREYEISAVPTTVALLEHTQKLLVQAFDSVSRDMEAALGIPRREGFDSGEEMLIEDNELDLGIEEDQL